MTVWRVRFIWLIFLVGSVHELRSQNNFQVLFLGNSYTAVNNLPQLIHDVALSAGDTLIFDSYTPGGYQLTNHYSDSISINKIINGNWDYVVIQGQSQEAITSSSQFYNGGTSLNILVKQHNPCAVTMPYMTWGRKNGDGANCPFFPVMCTYQGMDTTIRNRYSNLTSLINGEVAPVSVVWNFLRQNFPSIDLYQADESHPSAAGSYAAACAFYTMIFKKDPTLISYNAGLSSGDASIIRNAAKTIVFDNIASYDYKRLPISGFNFQAGPGMNEILFNPLNYGVQQTYFWDFGDGDTSSFPNPSHSYSANGVYNVTLRTSNCDQQGLHISQTDTIIQLCSHTPTIYTSHSWLCNYDTLWTQQADSYLWLANGIILPETNQYLPDYLRYSLTGFSVISTINSCSELSASYTNTPVWPGYYFDAMGNPCNGDTVTFAVLHINGFLSGGEIIRWYRNDTLLTSANNEDTLFITTGGKYECKVINPFSDCPADTTSYILDFNCNGSDMNESSPEKMWTIFPNPASDAIKVKFLETPVMEEIEIYDASGHLSGVFKAAKETILRIQHLSSGVYFIRLKNKNQYHKFIKL